MIHRANHERDSDQPGWVVLNQHLFECLELLYDQVYDNDWLKGGGYCNNSDGRFVDPLHRSAVEFSLQASITVVATEYAYEELTNEDFWSIKEMEMRFMRNQFVDFDEYFDNMVKQLGGIEAYEQLDFNKAHRMETELIDYIYVANANNVNKRPCGAITSNLGKLQCWEFQKQRTKDDMLDAIENAKTRLLNRYHYLEE